MHTQPAWVRGLLPASVRKGCLGSYTRSASQAGDDGWSKSPKISWGSSPPLHIQGNSCPVGQGHCTSIPASKAHITDLLTHTSTAIDQVGNVSYGDAFTHWLTCLPSHGGMSTLALLLRGTGILIGCCCLYCLRAAETSNLMIIQTSDPWPGPNNTFSITCKTASLL